MRGKEGGRDEGKGRERLYWKRVHNQSREEEGNEGRKEQIERGDRLLAVCYVSLFSSPLKDRIE